MSETDIGIAVISGTTDFNSLALGSDIDGGYESNGMASPQW